MSGIPYGWIAAGGFFLLLLAAARSPIVIGVKFKKTGKDEMMEVNVKALYGIVRYKREVPFMKFDGTSVKLQETSNLSGAGLDAEKQFDGEIDPDKVKSAIDKYKQVLHLIRGLKGWMRKTLGKVKLTEWHWNTSVGTGDAMWTAMATGMLWTLQSSILGVLSQWVKLQAEPDMGVRPDYRHPAFATEWSCIAQIRFGYAILAGLQLLVRMKKWKGGVKAWQNILFKA